MVHGPYIWHVKDEEPQEVKTDVQKLWKSPYFLRDTHANHLEAWDSFEFWFSLPGGGAFAHSDSYCEMTISTQLRGIKTWRLQMMPDLQTGFDQVGQSVGRSDRGCESMCSGSGDLSRKIRTLLCRA